MTTPPPQPTEPVLPGHCWGIARVRTPARIALPARHLLRRIVITVSVAATLFLGAAATALSSAAPAHADIFGISDTVEDWLCGIVAPDEPWEPLGSGPEALISNRNLVGARAVPVTAVTGNGERITIDPPNPDTVPDTMDELQALPDGSYTLYEIAGLRGLTWVTMPITADGTARSCNLWNYLFTQAGNAVFTVNKLILQVVIAVKEAAAAQDPLSFLYDDASGAVGTTFAVFAIPIACFAMLITGIWLGIRSATNRGQPREAVAAVVGGLFIAFLGGVLYLSNTSGTTGFRAITATVDQAINQASAVATNALFNGTMKGDQTCALPTDDTSVVRGQRVTSCMLADSLAYRPWAIGQFGAAGARPIALPEGWTPVSPGADGTIDAGALGEQSLPCYVDFDQCQDLRTYLIAQHGGIQIGGRLSGSTGYAACAYTADGAEGTTASLVTGDDNTVELSATTPCSPMFRTFQALAATNQNTAAAFSGAGAITRVTQAITANVGSIVAGVAVLVLGLITMVWMATVIALWITGAFKLPIAVYRNKIRLATEWGADLVHAWVCRLAYGIMLSIVILIINWMMNSTLSFGFKLLWLGILLWGLWKMIGKIQSLLRPGGASNNTQATDTQAALTKTVQGSTKLTRRTVSGGGAGGASAWESRRKLMTDPTRSKARRTVTALMTPLAVTAGAGRGVVQGPNRTNARRTRQMMKEFVGQQQNPSVAPDVSPDVTPAPDLQVPVTPPTPPTPPVPPEPAPAPEPVEPPAPPTPPTPPTPPEPRPLPATPLPPIPPVPPPAPKPPAGDDGQPTKASPDPRAAPSKPPAGDRERPSPAAPDTRPAPTPRPKPDPGEPDAGARPAAPDAPSDDSGSTRTPTPQPVGAGK